MVATCRAYLLLKLWCISCVSCLSFSGSSCPPPRGLRNWTHLYEKRTNQSATGARKGINVQPASSRPKDNQQKSSRHVHGAKHPTPVVTKRAQGGPISTTHTYTVRFRCCFQEKRCTHAQSRKAKMKIRGTILFYPARSFALVRTLIPSPSHLVIIHLSSTCSCLKLKLYLHYILDSCERSLLQVDNRFLSAAGH